MLEFFINALTVVNIIVAIIIINLVLMQRSKSGGGLGGITGGAGGGAAEEVFGSSAGNVLSRATVFFSIAFMIITLGLTVLQGKVEGGDSDTSVADTGMVDGEEDEDGTKTSPPDLKPAGSTTPTGDPSAVPPAGVVDDGEAPSDAPATDEAPTDAPETPETPETPAAPAAE